LNAPFRIEGLRLHFITYWAAGAFSAIAASSNTALTMEVPKETEGDIKITAAIRQAVVKNETLSINAQNIKIITRNGVVTLRGSVESEAENMKLEDIAKQTLGVMYVNNQLEIKAP
jgi:hyperosmotically inducible protein